MPDDDGLPPPVPQPRPVPIVRAPDLASGSINSSLSGIATSSSSLPGLAPSLRAGTPGTTSYQPFNSAGAQDALKPFETDWEKSVNPDDNPALAMLKSMWQAVTHPVTALVDHDQAGKIRDIQQAFLKKNADTLSGMARELSQAGGAMAALGRTLEGTRLPTHDIDGIMKQKASLGSDLMPEIEDALASATDPDDKTKLQAMRDDFQNWLKDRDSRVNKEWPEETRLQNCIDQLNREISRQASLLQQPATSPAPRYQATTDGSQVESTVQTPQAFDYVNGLRHLLLGSRAQITSILTAKGS